MDEEKDSDVQRYEAILARTQATIKQMEPISPYHASMLAQLSILGAILLVHRSEIHIIAACTSEDVDVIELELYRRRTMTRIIFSMIEAVSFRMKQLALQHLAYHPSAFTAAEAALLREEDYLLESNGKVRTQSARLSTLPNIRFAFASFSKALGLTHQIDAGGSDWQALQQALHVRDRLTHPKEPSDLIVSNEELAQVRKAYEWFLENMVTSSREGMNALLASFPQPK